jgi:hypothetical protein
MSTPGYYKTNSRALSLAGMVRAVGFIRLPLAWLLFRLKPPTSTSWMPALWADLECTKQDLSTQFWQRTQLHRGEFARLGFVEVAVKKLRKILNPMHRDNGGINYLDSSRTHFAQLMYNKVRAPAPINNDRERITIAFTAVFETGTLSYTNNKSPFDGTPEREIVRVASDDVASMCRNFQAHVARRGEVPRSFPDDDSLRQWFDSNQLRFFEDQVRRGVFVRMTDAEVEAARRKLPPPLPKTRG